MNSFNSITDTETRKNTAISLGCLGCQYAEVAGETSVEVRVGLDGSVTTRYQFVFPEELGGAIPPILDSQV
jgi:hypothetical protein